LIVAVVFLYNPDNETVDKKTEEEITIIEHKAHGEENTEIFKFFMSFVVENRE